MFSNQNSFGGSAHNNLECIDTHRPVPPWKFGVGAASMLIGAMEP